MLDATRARADVLRAEHDELLAMMLRLKRLKLRRIQPCGSYGAYRRHKRIGEKPCAACKAAANTYNSQHKRRTTA